MFLIICGIASIYICRIFKHGGLGLSFLFLLSAGLLSSLKAASDLPLFFSFFIMAAGIVVVLRIKPNNLTANGPYWFFAIGAATVYFDFLDTPIITLGVPLIIYLLRLLNEGFSIRKITFSIVTVAVLWAVGYGYLWCLKWCLAALVLGPSVVASALKAATFRLGIDQASAQYGTSPLEAIQINFSHLGFTKYVMILAVLVSVVFISILVIRSLRLRESLSPAYFGSIIMLVIVAMLPYLWYLIFSNHSCIHSWFVYRDQIVSLFALCSLAWYLGCRVFSESAEEKRKKILP